MRPRAGTAIPLSTAHARIIFGSRLALAATRRPRRCRPAATARLPIPRTLDGSRSNTCRALWTTRPGSSSTSSSSRHSPFHPSRTVSAPSDPSRSSTSTSTVAFAIASPFDNNAATLSEPPANSSATAKPSMVTSLPDGAPRHLDRPARAHRMRATERHADADLSQRHDGVSSSVESSRRHDEAGHPSKSELAGRISTAAKLRQLGQAQPAASVRTAGRASSRVGRSHGALRGARERRSRTSSTSRGVITRDHAVDQDANRHNMFVVDSGPRGQDPRSSAATPCVRRSPGR